MVGATDPDPIFSKRKAINALVPYAISLKRDGQEAMVDVISLAATASQSGRFIWHHIGPYTTILFDEPSPPTLNLIITLASSHVPWEELHDGTAVTRWAWAASALPDTECGRGPVADHCPRLPTALHSYQHLGMAEQRPSLPPVCWARFMGTKDDVRYVRALGDIEILKSYLLLVWLE